MKTLNFLFSTTAIFLFFTIVMVLTSCQKEEMKDVDTSITENQDSEMPTPPITNDSIIENSLIGIYVGESMIIQHGSKEIYTMEGNFVEYMLTSDTTFSKLDTVFVVKDVDDNHFKIRGSGAISQINDFASFTFIYDMKSEFEFKDGFDGYRNKSVKLVFDDAKQLTVHSYDVSIYGDKPEDTYAVIFSGIKQE